MMNVKKKISYLHKSNSNDNILKYGVSYEWTRAWHLKKSRC